MTSQQAGVSAEAVAKLVEKWETISKLYGASDAVRDAVYQQCADELKAVLRMGESQCCCNVSWLDLDIDDCPIHGPKALATAPPEQACPYKSQHNVGYRCPHCGVIEPADQPQAASAGAQSRSVQRRVALQKGEPVPTFGATSAGARNQNYLDDLRHDLQDEEFRFQYLAACATDSEGALRNGIKDVLEAALAAHDQKVRAEGRLEELKSLLTLVHGTQQHIPLTVPENCQFQICVDINSRIRSLASGAEEK